MTEILVIKNINRKFKINKDGFLKSERRLHYNGMYYIFIWENTYWISSENLKAWSLYGSAIIIEINFLRYLKESSILIDFVEKFNEYNYGY